LSNISTWSQALLLNIGKVGNTELRGKRPLPLTNARSAREVSVATNQCFHVQAAFTGQVTSVHARKCGKQLGLIKKVISLPDEQKMAMIRLTKGSQDEEDHRNSIASEDLSLCQKKSDLASVQESRKLMKMV
jgi:hypothetical protein